MSRKVAAFIFCALAGVTFLAWLIPSLLGLQPRVLPGVELGHWSNLRLSACFLAIAALLHPRREARLAPLERALQGGGRWALPVA